MAPKPMRKDFNRMYNFFLGKVGNISQENSIDSPKTSSSNTFWLRLIFIGIELTLFPDFEDLDGLLHL